MSLTSYNPRAAAISARRARLESLWAALPTQEDDSRAFAQAVASLSLGVFLVSFALMVL